MGDFKTSNEIINLNNKFKSLRQFPTSSSVKLPSFSERIAFTPRSHSKLIRNLVASPRILLDTESLCQENLELRHKLSALESDNVSLKQEILKLDEQYDRKTIPNDVYLIYNKNEGHVTKLKLKCQELIENLKIKNTWLEELKVKIRPKRILNTESQKSAKMQECIELKEKLLKALTLNKDSNEILKSDEVILLNTKEIESLSASIQNYYRELQSAQQELSLGRTRIAFIKKKEKKQNSSKRLITIEFEKARIQLAQLKAELAQQTEQISNKNLERTKQVTKLKNKFEELAKRLTATESQIKEKAEDVEKIRNLNRNYREVLKRSNTQSHIEEQSPNKLLNPPVFFVKLHQILMKKNLIVEVFLSLVDKNNKGALTLDEVIKAFGVENSPVDIKYIENAVKFMGCNEKHIPIRKIEDWYYKYDFGQAVEKRNTIAG